MPSGLAFALLPVMVESTIVTEAEVPLMLVLRIAPPPMPETSLTELPESWLFLILSWPVVTLMLSL